MDRRELLKTSGLAAAALAIPSILTPRKAEALSLPPINSTTLQASGTVHCIAAAHRFAGHMYTTDWANIAAADQNLLNYWQAHNLDAAIKPLFYRMSESQVSMVNIPVDKILAAIRVYNPAVTRAQVYDAINATISVYTYNGVDYRTVALNNLRTYGISPYIQDSITIAKAHLGTLAVEGITPNVLGLPNCTISKWSLFGLGLTLAVITIATDGGDLLLFSGWQMVTFWGGRAMVAMNIARAVLC